MTNRPNTGYPDEAVIFTTDHGPMIISRQHPEPQPLNDPDLLAILFTGQTAS